MAQKNQVRAKIANEELYKLSKNQMSKVDLCCKLHEAQHCSIVKYHLQQNNGSMHILQKSVAIWTCQVSALVWAEKTTKTIFSKFASKSHIFIVTDRSQQWLHCIRHTFWHMWRTSECRDFITTVPVSSVVIKLHTHWHMWMRLRVGTILIATALVHTESQKNKHACYIHII